ncbi:tetratricopeptide repeat protein [Mariniflexile ostreae]|uniref:Tetratricopeptide repeat protein n=1 Tax=Mariniflexile ostreae TaxID=1520892 RepID=A0ABV5F7W0_9FLAO
MFYYIVIALQVYCIYHLIKNRNPYYWIFIILFIPAIGCAIYLITQVYSKRNTEKLQDDIVSIIHPAKKIKDLEKRLEFSETFQNRVNLADAYLAAKEYQKAIVHYKKALEDDIQNDVFVIKQLIEALYKSENYEELIVYAMKIETLPEFKKTRTEFLCGLAYEKLGDLDEAEKHLKQIDERYSFYEERVILAKFLLKRDKKEEAKEIIDEIYIESQYMTKENKKRNRAIIAEVEALKQEF